MLNHIKQEANRSLTENGAVTYATSGSDCLDFFASVGGLRRASDQEIVTRFVRAYSENADLAMKILFFARDIRGGLGERRVFRTVLAWLAGNEAESVKKNMEYVAEYGRFDDLLALMDTPCEKEMLAFLKKKFEEDKELLAKGERVSLLGKWLPSINASARRSICYASRIAESFGMDAANYRKTLSALRRQISIIENNLRERDYSFDYAKQPSRALFKYKKAFVRNDGERYTAFLSRVVSGESRMHATQVAPYELIEPYLGLEYRGSERSYMRDISPEEKAILNATWASIPDFGGDEDAIAVIDTSGSMYFEASPLPAAVAFSLGLYFAERNRGIFRNYFIEFSAEPCLIPIKGKTFADRLRYAASFNKVADTNLESVFDLILDAAVRKGASQKDLPAKLIIISDMEFNACIGNASATNFNNAKRKYKEKGYILPEVIFWNVASRSRQVPVRMNEQGVTLISGATPRIFSMIAGGTLSPYTFMLEILGGERYAGIAA